MDLSTWDREHDPTLPLNEASVLPPSGLSGEDRANMEDIWSQYRTNNHVRTTVTPTTNEDGESDIDDEARLQQRDQAINMNRSLVSCLRDNGRKILSAGYTMKQVEEELVKLRNENFHLKLRIHLLEERQGLAMVRPEDKENVFRINLDLCVEKEGLKQEIDEKMKLLEDAYIALDSIEREKERDREMYEMEIEKLRSETENRTNRATKKQEELLLEAFGSMNLGTRHEDDEITPQDPAEEHFGLELPARSNVLEESFGVEVSGKIRQMGAQLERVKILETKLSSEKERVEQLSNENVDLRNEIAKLAKVSTENAELSQKIEEISNQNAELNHKFVAVSNHNAELQQEVEKLDKVLKLNEELHQEIQRLDSVLADDTLEIQKLMQELAARDNEINNIRSQSVETSNGEIETLRRQLVEKQSEIEELQDHVRNLQNRLNQGDEAYKESQAEAISKIAAMKSEIEPLRSQLRMKAEEVTKLRHSLEESSAEFKAKMEHLQSELASRDLDLTKTRMCVNGLAEFDSEQKEMIRNLERDLKKRNLALAKLTEEYEIAKAKVRKYRAEKASLDNKENIDNTNSSTTLFGGKNVGQILNEIEYLKKGKASLEQEVSNLKEQLLARSPKPRATSKSHNENDMALFEIVRREVSRVKNSCLRVGSEKALYKAKSVYTTEMRLLESTHNSVIAMMRRRLEELADFLEALLANGLLDLSLLSTHVRDSLHRSLNESRRLSLSFAANASMAGGDGSMSMLGLGNIAEHPETLDPNETQNEAQGGDVMPEFKVPTISIKLTDEDLEIGDGFETTGNDINLDNIVSNILSSVQESNTNSLELQAQITTLQSKVSEMEDLHTMVESLKRDNKSKEHELLSREMRLQQLETELHTTEAGYNHVKAKCAETSSILEELRITHGQVKERLREKSKQFDLLEEKLRQKSEGQKEIARLKSELARGQSRIEELQMQLKKVEAQHKLEIEKLNSKLEEAREAEDAERDRLRREMRDKLERVIRPQLAKTHSVLKKTGASLEKASHRMKPASELE